MLPMLTISILYLLIGLQLRRDKLVVMVDSKCIFGTESLSRSRKQKLSKRNVQVTKMLSRYQPANWSIGITNDLQSDSIWSGFFYDLIQVCWWWSLVSAGLPFTWTDWCGATWIPALHITSRSSSTSTSSPGFASTWAQSSTPSSTTSCPVGLEKCSVTWHVTPAARQDAPVSTCRIEEPPATKRPRLPNGLKEDKPMSSLPSLLQNDP